MTDHNRERTIISTSQPFTITTTHRVYARPPGSFFPCTTTTSYSGQVASCIAFRSRDTVISKTYVTGQGRVKHDSFRPYGRAATQKSGLHPSLQAVTESFRTTYCPDSRVIGFHEAPDYQNSGIGVFRLLFLSPPFPL